MFERYLTLTLRPGQDVYVGDVRIVLEKINAMNRAVVSCEGKDTNIDFEDWKTVKEGIYVMMGYPRGIPQEAALKEARIQFRAPEKLILRGSSYRKGKVEKQ